MLNKKVKSGKVKGNRAKLWKKLGPSAINSQVGFLQGRILTILDASIADARRNKAIKDLVRSEFFDTMANITKLCLGDDWMKALNIDESMIEEVSEEEVDKLVTGKK